MTDAKIKNKRRINGVLLLDKAVGLSSNAALQQVRRLYNAQKAGHTGVLDPAASGLLPICFGEATKFAQYLLDADKTYIATLRTGASTDTGDAEGVITQTCDFLPDEQTFQAACNDFLGESEQIPPMYSALKYQGRALYDYARSGIEIERKSRLIHIKNIEILSFRLPEIILSISCSKGTYIRVLAEDIAKKAGTLAHLTALRRTATAGFIIEQAHSYEKLNTLNEQELDNLLLPCEAGLTHLPEMILPDKDICALQQGKILQVYENQDIMRPFRIYTSKKRFIGLAQNFSGILKPLRLMSTEAER